MGRYYDGDIEGKFWFAIMESDVASVFGDEGEEIYYCEARLEFIRASEIRRLTAKEKGTLCSEPSYLYYNYGYSRIDGVEKTNFKIDVLQKKIKDSKSLIAQYASLIDEKKSKDMLKSKDYIKRLYLLSYLIRDRRLRETSATRYDNMLFGVANLLSCVNKIKKVDALCEVAIGSKIFASLLKSGKCEFEGEL